MGLKAFRTLSSRSQLHTLYRAEGPQKEGWVMARIGPLWGQMTTCSPTLHPRAPHLYQLIHDDLHSKLIFNNKGVKAN